MKSLLRKFSDSNPERFNSNFILSRKEQNILEYVTEVFKSLEVIEEIKVKEVKLDTDESAFGPIKSQHKYYKAILPSRLNKIHYKIEITPKENIDDTPTSFTKEGDIFINKLIDNCFYINEGIRYFLIYQIVDNATYGARGSVVLKSLLMPIAISKNECILTPEFGKNPIQTQSFDVQLFSRRINPVLYVMAQHAHKIVSEFKPSSDEKAIEERKALRDITLIDTFNSYFGTSFMFSDDLNDFIGMDSRTVFRIMPDRGGTGGVYIAIDNDELANNYLAQSAIGCISNIYTEKRKKKVPTYEDIISPWFWIDCLSSCLNKNTADEKKLDKVKTILISLNRLIDKATRRTLNIPDTDKENTMSVIKYMLREYESLIKEDSQDLNNKRIRLFEYELYCLRKYFSDQIYRVLNSPTRSRAVLDRMFSNLTPMYVIKQTVVNELLRYYNSPNELNLFSAFLKYTFRGPQSINKTIAVNQRDIHPSYTGRLSLIASSASDPGTSGTFVPFLEVNNYYFKK